MKLPFISDDDETTEGDIPVTDLTTFSRLSLLVDPTIFVFSEESDNELEFSAPLSPLLTAASLPKVNSSNCKINSLDGCIPFSVASNVFVPSSLVLKRKTKI